MRVLAAGFRILQSVSPSLAARVAERLLFTPPRSPASVSVRAFLATGRGFELRADGRRVVGWRWGRTGGPVVYLVHGWGGRGGRLSAIAEPLVDAGYAVVTFDAPGHGASGKGMSSMPEFARALAAVVARHGPPHAIIAHSLGAAATSLAVSWGLAPRRMAFLAPPLDPAAWVVPFARALGLRQEVVAALRTRSERRLRIRWSDLHVGAMAPRLTTPLLIVHDRGDDTVAWEDGHAIAAAWPGADFVSTDGLGHRGVARAPAVVRRVIEFVAGGGAVPVPFDETERLEYELFHRDVR